jgi:hypothetical protein
MLWFGYVHTTCYEMSNEKQFHILQELFPVMEEEIYLGSEWAIIAASFILRFAPFLPYVLYLMYVLFLYAWIILVYCHCFKFYFTTEQSIVKLTRPALWGEHTASSEGRQEEEIDPAGLTFLWHITFSGLMRFVLGFIYTHCSYLFLFLLSLFLSVRIIAS